MSLETLRLRAERAFASFNHAPDLTVQAPGRVNLIGEHTDYNGGFVLPCAIDRGTVVVARRRDDTTVRAIAADIAGEIDLFELDGAIAPEGGWRDYVRGVVLMLTGAGLARGADLAIAGDIPQGAGLSSSASLEVGIATALDALHEMDLGPARIARLAQAAENDFVGCACGIMDQLIAARAQAGHALLIDCQSLECRPVPMPEGLTVMVIESGVTRGLVGSAYNERRGQCAEAARHFGVAALRDVDRAMLESKSASSLDPLVFRRARHVVTENAHTLAAADALADGDLRRLGMLMAQSHVSMRDDFEITVPAIDRLVDIAATAIGKEGGARMTGGGFGGCVVALAPTAMVDVVRSAVARNYLSPTGMPAPVHVCRPSAGSSLI